MNRISCVSVILALTSSPVWAGGKTVGTTKDACDRHDDVTFQTRSGPARVKNDQKEHRFEMVGMVREFQWYCGGSRERVANDRQFNVVVIKRAENGAISWTFQVDDGGAVSPAGKDAPRDLIRVGDSADACDRSQAVTVTDRSGHDVSIKAGDMQLVELAHPTESLRWHCGTSGEWVRNHADFDHVEIERAGNGAIQWVFFRDPTSHSADTGAFIHDARGIVRIAGLTSADELPASLEPDLGKQLVSSFDAVRSDVEAKIEADLMAHAGGLFPGAKIKKIDLTLPGAANLELRTVVDRATLRIKLVAHDVTAVIDGTVSGMSGSFKVTLDLDVIWTLPRSGKASALKVQSTDVFAHHVDLAGNDTGSGLAITVFKPMIREIGNSFAGHSLDGSLSKANLKTLADLVDKPLAALTDKAPATAIGAFDLDPAGEIKACVKLTATAPACKFRPDPGPVTARAALDSSIDRCGERTLWLWDVENGQFVRIAQGSSNVRVEIENSRFEWYCGSDASPDVRNQEWAAGPLATRTVSVTRERGGRRIDWQFLSWK